MNRKMICNPRIIGQIVGLCCCLVLVSNVLAQSSEKLILSADVSYVEELEANGVVYKEAGEADDLFAILSRNGINTIRLRLWHTPAEPWYDLESTVRIAKRVKEAGLDFLLDFHYSDTWADPGRQTKPAAWTGLSFDVLRDSVYTYTHQVLSEMKENDVLPEYVQIGNETSQGFLWDEGRVGGNFNGAAQWSQLRTLFNDAIRAVRDVEGDDRIQVILHTDRGGDTAGATWFFDNVTTGTTDFEIIGLSYYPWWHGTLDDMQNTINAVAGRYGKSVFIAETAYPWTLQWFDNTNNLVGLSNQLLPGYENLPDAQYNFLRDVISRVQAVPDGLGAGISYWAPENISVSGVGSVWENVTLFDNNGELLPAIQAFKEAVNVEVERPEINDVRQLDLYPNPFLNELRLSFFNEAEGEVSVSLYDTLGREKVSLLTDRWLQRGEQRIALDAGVLPAGMYLCVIDSPSGREIRPVIRL